MASRESRTFEVLLNGMDMSACRGIGSGRHLVTLELLCPRPLVASKSAVRTFKFSGGVLDCGPLPWVKRIYFKENVEFRFGLCVRVSASVTSAYVNSFFRYFAGAIFGIGADAVESAVGGIPGDLAAVPLDYAKKKFMADRDAAIIAEGAVDLLPSELSESQEVAVPLCALRNAFKVEHGRGASSQSRRLVQKEGAVVGTARIQLNLLK